MSEASLHFPAPPPVDTSHAASQVRARQLSLRAGGVMPPPLTGDPKAWPPDYDAVLAWRADMLAKFEMRPKLLWKAKGFYRDHPVEFINHWCDTYDPRKLATGKPTKFPLILFPRQALLVDFLVACMRGEAPALIEKARDMGATWVCIAISVWLWLFHPGSASGWGSNKQDKVDKLGVPDSIFEKIRMLIWSLPAVFRPAELDTGKHLFYMRCINPVNGATITGEIGDNIGRGGRTLIYFVDEAAHLERPEAVEGSLSETTRTRVDISSVSGLGTVFYRKRMAGVDWAPGQLIEKHQTNVFVLDWSDHPDKTQDWYEKRKAYFEANGLGHVFAREIERNYAAAVEGVIIRSEWVDAAIDADQKLGLVDDGGWMAALDVADGGTDSNAATKRKGIFLKQLEEWAVRDTAITTRRALAVAKEGGTLPIELQYDSVGLGSGVKAEYNRLVDDNRIPMSDGGKILLRLVPWNAGSKVLNPDGFVNTKRQQDHPFTSLVGIDQPDDIKNKDYFENFKAQGWYELARRFELTFRAVTETDFTYNPGDLIVMPSSIPLMRKLQKELSQAVWAQSTSLKMMVDKTPKGTKSPNLADVVMMVFWPWVGRRDRWVSTAGPIVLRSQ